jgi:hypothetical protein
VPAGVAAARGDLVEAADRLSRARAEAVAARREGAARQVQARRDELRTAASEVGRLRNGLTLLRQQLDAVRELAARGLYPKLKLVAAEKQSSDTRGELAKAESAQGAAKAALAEAESRLSGHRQGPALGRLGRAGEGGGRARPPGRAAGGAGRGPRRHGPGGAGGGRRPGSPDRRAPARPWPRTRC